MTGTETPAAVRRRRSLRVLSALTVALLAVQALADGLSHHVVVNAGGTVSAGNLTLHYSIGEPLAGDAAAGPWRLTSGFQALFTVAGDGSDTIFADGFEAAQP